MRTSLLAVLVLAGCPKGGSETSPEPEPTFVDGPPGGAALCLSPVREAGKLRGDDRDVWHQAVAALKERDVGRAASILSAGSDHAGLEALRGITSLAVGNLEVADTRYDLVLYEAPEDWCALMTGAMVAAQMGDADTARERASLAWAANPDEPEAGFLRAMTLSDDPTAFTEALREVAARFPDHGSTQLALYQVETAAGNDDAALQHLEAAVAAGAVPAEVLYDGYLVAGRIAEALVIASRSEEPLGDDGAIATADDPLAAYYALFGATPGQTLVATINTSMGPLRCELFPEDAPITVANFGALAAGRLPWVDPRENTVRTTPLYSGTTFHRVIPEFMIQGGDPAGDGTGGPGYRFRDEVVTGLTFDRPGRLAMANAGPGTNGSQWFITEGMPQHLNGRHTIFGQCDEPSTALAQQIARVDRDSRDRPLVPVVIERISVRGVDPAPPPAPPEEPAEVE